MEGIWKRSGSNTLSKSLYLRSIAAFTLLVTLVVAKGAMTSYTWKSSWGLFIGSFIVSIIAIIVFTASDKPLISGIGVTVLSYSLGLMMGPMLTLYNGYVISQALVTTGTILIIMTFAGITYPKVFEGLGPYLFSALIFLIIAMFGQIIFVAIGYPQAANMPIINWIAVLIFTLYIAYDWSRALSLPYTLDNAIDVSGALILDLVNLFVHLLQIFSN